MSKSINDIAKAMFYKQQQFRLKHVHFVPLQWDALDKGERRAWRALAKEHQKALWEKEREIKRLFGVEGA